MWFQIQLICEQRHEVLGVQFLFCGKAGRQPGLPRSPGSVPGRIEQREIAGEAAYSLRGEQGSLDGGRHSPGRAEPRFPREENAPRKPSKPSEDRLTTVVNTAPVVGVFSQQSKHNEKFCASASFRNKFSGCKIKPTYVLDCHYSQEHRSAVDVKVQKTFLFNYAHRFTLCDLRIDNVILCS